LFDKKKKKRLSSQGFLNFFKTMKNRMKKLGTGLGIGASLFIASEAMANDKNVNSPKETRQIISTAESDSATARAIESEQELINGSLDDTMSYLELASGYTDDDLPKKTYQCFEFQPVHPATLAMQRLQAASGDEIQRCAYQCSEDFFDTITEKMNEVVLRAILTCNFDEKCANDVAGPILMNLAHYHLLYSQNICQEFCADDGKYDATDLGTAGPLIHQCVEEGFNI
jgi:hypothetical protein